MEDPERGETSQRLFLTQPLKIPTMCPELQRRGLFKISLSERDKETDVGGKKEVKQEKSRT